MGISRTAVASFILMGAMLGQAAAPPATDEAGRALRSLPAWFEPNAGRFSPEVRFFSRGGAGTLLVEPGGAVYRAGDAQMRVRLSGADPRAVVEGVAPTGARTSWFTGRDRNRWSAGIAHYAKVRSREVYPGIDLVYYLAGQELEFDFLLAAGADPGRIRMAFEGAGRPTLDRSGDLVFSNGLRQKRPVAYQEAESGRKPVDVRYTIARNGEIRFAVDDYDRSAPLVIDPVLSAAYFGGDSGDTARAIAIDKRGDIWVTGSSASTVASPATPIQAEPKGERDVFIARLRPDGNGKPALVYWTQLGGDGVDEATSIAVDDAGFVYVAGYSTSEEFPGGGVKLQEKYAGETDAFIAKIRPMDDGTAELWYSQQFGGGARDIANAVAVDSTGAIYIAGYTTSTSLPGANEGQVIQASNRGGYECFLAKIAPDSSSPLSYATFLGGKTTDVLTAVAVKAPGELYLAGYTASDDFPVTWDAQQNTMRSNLDLFVAEVNLGRPALDALVYATYIGGNAMELPHAVKVDAQGGVWLGGYTFSTDFPVTPNAYRNQPAGEADLFLLRFDMSKRTSNEAIAYGTYLGGADADVLYGIELLPDGRIALAGYTFSGDYPLAGSALPQPWNRGGGDAFVTVLDTTKAGPEALAYSELISGRFGEAATGVAADAEGNLYLSGYTYSADFPVTDGNGRSASSAVTQSFVVKAR